jgi:hypothetical protein
LVEYSGTIGIKQMKKILITILMLGFVFPVFAKVQKPLKSTDTSICVVSKRPRRTHFTSKLEVFVSVIILGTVGTLVTLLVKTLIHWMYKKGQK